MFRRIENKLSYRPRSKSRDTAGIFVAAHSILLKQQIKSTEISEKFPSLRRISKNQQEQTILLPLGKVGLVARMLSPRLPVNILLDERTVGRQKQAYMKSSTRSQIFKSWIVES